MPDAHPPIPYSPRQTRRRAREHGQCISLPEPSCPMQAFKEYVLTILTRTNTITGVKYYEDPTIFALELANEPHTTDGFEATRGLAPGSLIRRWMKEIVEFIRQVDTNHMVSFMRLSQLQGFDISTIPPWGSALYEPHVAEEMCERCNIAPPSHFCFACMPVHGCMPLLTETRPRFRV